MKAKSSLTCFLAIASLVAAASPAAADSFAKFYQGPNGGASYGGPFNGAATVYGQTQGLATNCPSLGSCTSDNNTQSSLVFTALGITASATNVWGDFSPNFGGLGVGNVGTSAAAADDQINIGEILRIHFSSPVTLTGVGTLFDGAHSPFGSGFGNGSEATVGPLDFLFCSGLNCNPTTGVSFASANNRTLSGAQFTGTDFAFTESSVDQVEFYVSGLSYNPVPGPIAGAGVPGLVAACAGLWGFVRRRRKLVV